MLKRLTNWIMKISRCHCSDDDTASGTIANFIIPRMTVGFFIRFSCVVALSIVVFGFVLLPCVISGGSMEPTIRSHGFTFCWRGRYLFGKTPQRGDIVIIKYTDDVFFLKRVIGLPGETIEFRRGQLFVNGKEQHEPYVKFICDWNLPPRKISEKHYYVVGDNRSMPIEQHRFGQVSSNKIIGSPLW
jgi:signal peptidase I